VSKYKLSNYSKSKNIVFGSNCNNFTVFQKCVDETQHTCMQLAITNLIQKLLKKKKIKQIKIGQEEHFFAEYYNIVPVITIKIKKEEQKNNKIMLQK
jgi:hypothetical protein